MGTFHRITEVSYIQEVNPRDCEKTVELGRRPAQRASVDGRRRHIGAHKHGDDGGLAFVRITAAHVVRRDVWSMLPLDTEFHGGGYQVVLLCADLTVDCVSHVPSSRGRGVCVGHSGRGAVGG
jgi:hypothetical protein